MGLICHPIDNFIPEIPACDLLQFGFRQLRRGRQHKVGGCGAVLVHRHVEALRDRHAGFG